MAPPKLHNPQTFRRRRPQGAPRWTPRITARGSQRGEMLLLFFLAIAKAPELSGRRNALGK